jgi:DNA-binding transcriptional LysR family regulator
MNLYVSMKVFERVATLGNFSTAARDLRMSTSAVSRHVADLERMLGVTLLRRTTRHVSQTEAGARYLSRASTIFEEIERLNAEISNADATPRGQLRITAPPAIGHDWLAPLVVDFLESYPDIDLELDLTERLVDLVGEGYDAAIRAGPLASSSLIAHRIIEMRYLLCASPDYLRRRGTPKRPDDIREHDCIHWCSGVNDNQWTFTKDGARISAPIRGRLLMSSFATGRAAAVRGLGLTVRPLISAREDLEAGRLVHVMPDYELERETLSLVRPPTPFEPPKLRAFIDFITAALRERTSFDPRTLLHGRDCKHNDRETAASE